MSLQVGSVFPSDFCSTRGTDGLVVLVVICATRYKFSIFALVLTFLLFIRPGAMQNVVVLICSLLFSGVTAFV